MSRAGLLLLLFVVLAIAAGFLAGWRAHITFGGPHYRQMAPPVPPDLALVTPAPSPTLIAGLYEYASPTISGPASPPPRVETARRTTSRKSPGNEAPRSESRKLRDYRIRHHSIEGTARWHATGRDGWYAAAGCRLRRAIRQDTGHDWRGMTVLVSFRRRAIEVRLNDAIGGCTKTLIDLSDEAFAALRPLSRGTAKVTVGW